ncbi:lipocalin family protein [Aestuariibaculum sp. M13]|uniref:lipocalin family protein n=1 Tax=Aestuariibaculum sp. M13 TaxID=2967132 RepID=UPI002159E259|nr:lipocalin family protein [Aestuariibaculum sp. M13]MCR8669083.1 lipocalin family protein [Aestuariibaculum sp. M13]
MKNTFFLFVVFLILFNSCSSDDTKDRIIGNWQVIEIYSNGEKAEQLGCSEYTYLIINYDFTTTGDFKNYETTPEICNSTGFELNKWRKAGNQYELIDGVEDVVEYTAFFQGENLVIENLSKTIKWFYIPY